MRTAKTLAYISCIVLMMLTLQTPAWADLYIQYSQSYTDDSVDPGYPATPTDPWLFAWFEDSHEYGSEGVLLTLGASRLLDGEFVSKWFFNLREDFDVNELTFDHLFGVVPKLDTNVALTDESGFDQSGAHIPLEIFIPYDTSNSKNSDRFTGGEISKILISGIAGLVAQDFNTPIVAHAALWVSVAHVQGTGIDNEQSAWLKGLDPPIPVPEPSTWLLMGLGLLATSFIRKARKT